jgi:hypothetical protein
LARAVRALLISLTQKRAMASEVGHVTNTDYRRSSASTAAPRPPRSQRARRRCPHSRGGTARRAPTRPRMAPR